MSRIFAFCRNFAGQFPPLTKKVSKLRAWLKFAEIRSHWVDPSTGNHPKPIPATADIRQTYSTLYVRLQTPSSYGDLHSCQLKLEEDGRFRLYGIYQNIPALTHRTESQIHRGAMILEVEGDPNKPRELRGEYWTDRDTRGELILYRRS